MRLAVRDGALVVSSPLRRFQLAPRDVGCDVDEVIKAAPGNIHEAMHYADVDGLDFYCPECDEVMCEDRYKLNPLFDEGFYDYTVGRCPVGHHRIVDD